MASSGAFQNAHDIVINNPTFIDNSQTTNVNHGADSALPPGLRELLKVSMPDAFYDAAARKNPPRCHLGTREAYIEKMAEWGTGTPEDHPQRLMWIHGPAGVGKSAIAQSCAEVLAERKALAAAIFISRPNQRNDQNHIFPSIAYQIATRVDQFADILDRCIRKDPTLLTKKLSEQFRQLLVEPLKEVQTTGSNIAEGHVVMLDGLDECADLEAQPELIEIIASSIRQRTTPFRWIILSRPERHIVLRFRSAHVSPVLLHVEIPVSREIDHEILKYLVDELTRIGEEYFLPATWLLEKDSATLVELSAGLFIYAATVIRFIGDRNSTGPVDRLNAVLALHSPELPKKAAEHPLSSLDLFYTLIVKSTPPKVLPLTQRILLLHSRFINLSGVCPADGFAAGFDWMPIYAAVLDISESQFRAACAPLHSVLDTESQSPKQLVFYHASFMDFMQDHERSKEVGVHTVMKDLRIEIFNRLHLIHSHSEEGRITTDTITFTWAFPAVSKQLLYCFLVTVCLQLCLPVCPLDSRSAAMLSKFEFRLTLAVGLLISNPFSPGELVKNVPPEHRHKIVWPLDHLSLLKRPSLHDPEKQTYVLGHGKNMVICRLYRSGAWYFEPYHLLPPPLTPEPRSMSRHNLYARLRRFFC